MFSGNPNNLANHENHLSITSKESSKERKDKHILVKGIIGEISILRVQSIKTYFTRYFGKQEIFLNGQVLPPKVIKVLRQGSSIKNPRITPIYYSDVIAQFLSEESTEKIEFTANSIEYKFSSGKKDYEILHSKRRIWQTCWYNGRFWFWKINTFKCTQR